MSNPTMVNFKGRKMRFVILSQLMELIAQR